MGLIALQDPGMTLVLVGLHLIIYAIGLLLTRYPVVSVFHMVLATHVLAFVVRPCLAALDGGYMLYPVGQRWSFYNLGLIYEMIFVMTYVAGYVFGNRNGSAPSLSKPPASVVAGFWLSLGLGVVVVILIHVLTGGAWLPTVRGVAITRVIPFGKLLFPLAVIPLSMSIPLGYQVGLRQARLWPIVGVGWAVAIVLLSLLYQRGFVLSGLILVMYLWNRYTGFGYMRAVFGGMVLIVLLAGLRPFAHVVSGMLASGKFALDVELSESVVAKFKNVLLYSPNFDSPDVWPIAISYVKENGLALGSTFIGAVLRMFSAGFRRQVGVTTAVDRLNEFYWGERYWSSGFGFNVSFAQELFMNWGPISLIAGFIPGVLTARLDRWLWSRPVVGVISMYGIAAVFATGGFLAELGGVLQWVLAYVVLGQLFDAVVRLRWFGARVSVSQEVEVDDVR